MSFDNDDSNLITDHKGSFYSMSNRENSKVEKIGALVYDFVLVENLENHKSDE